MPIAIVSRGVTLRDGNSRTPDGPSEPTDTSGDGGLLDTGETPVLASRPDAFSEPASVHVIVESDRTRIVLSGEVDADLAADLREATADAEATGLPIEVDTQHVTFMDSSGIAFLARLATRSTDRVKVIRAPETVRFLLEVTRIGELLDVVGDGEPEPLPVPEHDLPTIGPAGRTRPPVIPVPDDIA